MQEKVYPAFKYQEFLSFAQKHLRQRRSFAVSKTVIWSPIVLFCTALLTACGSQRDAVSRLKGHYEGMRQTEAAQIASKKPVVAPEYAPTETVILSGDLVSDRGYRNTALAKAVLEAGAKLLIIGSQTVTDGLESEEFSGFRRALGSSKSSIRVLKADLPMAPSSWARDWSPMTAFAADRSRILVDFNYYTTRPTDDEVPSLLAASLKTSQRLSVPVYLEGGNFMTTSKGRCMTTSRILEANSDQAKTYIVDAQGLVVGEEGSAPLSAGHKLLKGILYFDRAAQPRIRTDELLLGQGEIVRHLREAAGCQEVTIFPKLPFESTGHLDMWAKALNDETILVGAIEKDEAARLPDRELGHVGKQIGRYLDARAKDFEKMKFKVIRIPMPLPHRLDPRQKERNLGDAFGFRSFTNSLFIVTAKGKTVLVPRYSKVWVRGLSDETKGRYPYPDFVQTAAMERQVQTIYQSAGYSVSWIEADEILAYGGAVHCATMQMPQGQ